MCKTNTGKRIALLLAVIAIMAATASAYTPPYKLMVFTDKQVYLDYGYDFDTAPYTYTQNDNAKGSFDQRPNVFAILLDSDGNIVKGLAGANFSARLKDVERWNHSGPGLTSYPFYTVYNINGQYYNSTNFVFTDADGDGIFNSTNDVVDLNQLASPPPVTDHVNISINVTARYLGVNYTSTVFVIFGTAGCHHPANGIESAHIKGNHDSVVCTACHWGYQYALGVHGKDNPIMADDPARYSDAMARVGGYDYKLGRTGGTNATDYNNSGSGYCIMCHGGQKLVRNANLLDLGTGGDGGRPSCSWYQGPAGNGSSNPVCHAPQQGYDGSTKITWSSLNGTDWKGWTAGPGTSKSHNHSTTPKTNGTPCELCHAGGGAPGTGTGGLHLVAGLPNRTSDYSSINDQCRFCHNNTDGWLNITSNGGTAKNHSRSECANCHIESNKLNAHNVPVGAYGGKWCLDCHNLTGKAPVDMRIDPLIANVSNANYTHYRLNRNADSTNSSRICWACHTNNSMVQNGIVNASRLQESEHPGSFNNPRNCTSCHNNSNASLSFNAPQTYRHTWYAPDMKTPAVTYCTNCHARDEMVNAWDESVYPPKTDNESSAHYGKNRTLSFPQIGSREYCGYCHQNESTVMGPFADPNNEVRSDHASQNTTPGCGNDLCHNPGRMHEDTLVVPVFNETNINTTCLLCHSQTNYSFHNNTLTCWDCHMGNVSNGTATWIHPIQFIQYNGNFTGAKLTGATCYDCHKSTSVDSTIQNLSLKKAPKVYNQAHSSDPNNGTKWGDYWKYTPTTYNFASYFISSGVVNPAYPFDNIRVPSNDFMEIIENHTGSANIPVQFPYNKAESQIEGPPVPNWTSYSKVTAGTTTLTAIQDGTTGNQAGSLKASLKTRSASGTGYVSWNYSFYYRPDTGQYAYTSASAAYNITVSSSLAQNVYFRLIKPSGTVVILASASSSSNTGWLTLSNNSFASALDEDGSVTPYKIQLYTELSGSGSKTVQNPYSVYYDNIIVRFQEKVWNRYEVVINTSGVPVNGTSKLGMSYQVHIENTYLQIYNKTSRAYEPLDIMDRGVFFDYVKNISSHHIDSSDGLTGNVSVKFIDTDQNDTDAVSDKLHIRYLYVFTDRGLQYPCEQCHSPNKHYVNPTIGSPEKFRAGNRYNSSDLKNSTWCQQCHWQGAANYSKMIQEFNVTRNPPENIPPEITGNKTYGKLNTSRDGKTAYVNHTGSAYSDMSDYGCFRCHGKAGDMTTSQFIHNVQVGQSGNRRCTTCHNTSAFNTNYKKVDVEAVRRGMHGNLKNTSANVGNTSDPIELACWACHGDGVYNNSDLHRNANAWSCDRCHTNATAGKLGYNAPAVYEHIPPNLATPEADIRTATAWACADCHNNSVNATALINDNENAPNTAIAGHYGLNRTAGMLMYGYSNPPKGDSEDCIYCHKGNSTNMTRWGVNISSTKNLNNKISPTDHRTFTNNDCGGCHNYTVTPAFTFHNSSLGNGSGGGGGSNCISCHNIGGSRNNVNFSAFNLSMHATINSGAQSAPQNAQNKPCWGCHGTMNGTYANESDQTGGDHNTTVYKNPRKCYDCHITGSLKFTVRNVTDHIPSGYTAGTDVSVTSYCSYCHNNSANNGYEPDGMGITGGSPVNASVSHYGANKTGKKLMAEGINSTECIYCHRNSTNMIKWGIMQGSPANISNKNASGGGTNHDSYTLSGDCNQCHGGYIVTWGFTFHNGALGSGIGSGPDCRSCHDIGGMATGKLVNFSAMNDTGAIHKNLNSGAPSSVNAENRKCWACHDEGAEPSGHNQSRYRQPYNCTDCHTSSGIKSGKYPGWNVTEHVKQGTVNGTEIFAPQADNCYSCHNTSEMMVGSALDPDGASGSIYGGANGGSSSTSHYGKKRDLGLNDTYCNYCHNNATTAFAFNETHNKGIIEHTGNIAADIRNEATLNCTDCHTTNAASYRLHNSTLYTQTVNVWTVGKEDRCAPCHLSTGSGSNLKVNNIYHNTTAGYITDCGYCHNSDAMRSSAPQNVHSDNLTRGGNSSFNNCYNCHQNGFASRVIFEHTNSTFANITNSSLSCEKSGCHNNNRVHSNSLIIPQAGAWTSGKQDRCAPCHRTTGSGSVLKINNTYHNTTTGDITDCGYCHNSEAMKSSAPQDIHSGNLTKGGSSTYNNCYNCHQNGFTSKVIIEHTNSTGANITNAGMTCEKSGCHNSSKTHAKTLAKPATSFWTVGGNDSCAPCHNSSDSMNNATKKIYRQGHDPANRTNDDVTSCGNCHNVSTPGGVPASFRLHDSSLSRAPPNASTCQGCHNGTSLYVGAKQILSHMPNASQYRGNTSMSNYTCEYCHNMTNKPSMHSAGMNRSSGTCITCHFNRTSPFKAGVKMIAVGNYNHTYSGQTSCNITMCHNASGGSVFHIDKYAAGVVGEPEKFNNSWNNRNSYGFPAPYSPYADCIDCHREYYDTSPFYAPYFEANLTGENKKNHSASDSVDACYNCHTNRTDGKDRYMVHNVTIEPLLGGPSCIRCHNQSAPITSGYPPQNKKVNHTALNRSVHKNLTNFTAWNESKKQNSVLLDSACWTCHATNITELPNNAHPDRGGPAPPKKPFQCEECHTAGGNASILNRPVYDNATKVSKHYPGSVFLGEIVFSGSVICSKCHKNSLVANTNVSGDPNSSRANDINVSHYGTRTGLTNTSPDLNGCQKCHGVGGQGLYAPSYGNARTMPQGHNDMGATPMECAENCHNSALDESGLSLPVKLHNSSVGIYVGTGNCYAAGCHTPPPPCSDDECRR